MMIQHKINFLNKGGQGTIIYNKIFTTVKHEYQRMQVHNELSTVLYMYKVPVFGADSYGANSGEEGSMMGMEAWLDDDDDDDNDKMEDEGVALVIGRTQFFMGTTREFIKWVWMLIALLCVTLHHTLLEDKYDLLLVSHTWYSSSPTLNLCTYYICLLFLFLYFYA